MPLNVILLIIAWIILIPTLIIYNIKYLIYRAIKKFVKPALENKGLTYINYKWCGFFSHGSFKDDPIEITFISSKYGNSSNSIYADVYYDDNKSQKSITIRIDTVFGFVKRIAYSDDSFKAL